MVKIVKRRAAVPAPGVQPGLPGHRLAWVGSQGPALTLILTPAPARVPPARVDPLLSP